MIAHSKTLLGGGWVARKRQYRSGCSNSANQPALSVPPPPSKLERERTLQAVRPFVRSFVLSFARSVARFAFESAPLSTPTTPHYHFWVELSCKKCRCSGVPLPLHHTTYTTTTPTTGQSSRQGVAPCRCRLRPVPRLSTWVCGLFECV